MLKLMPRVVGAVAAIAAAKRSNRELEARQKVAAEEAARRRAEAERRRQLEEKQLKLLDEIVAERRDLDQLAALVRALRDNAGAAPQARVARLLAWAGARLAAGEQRLAAGALAERLATVQLFGEADDAAAP